MHPLHQHIAAVTPFTEAEFENALPHFKSGFFNRKTKVILPGQYVKSQYFVIKGCLRTFLIDPDGKEHTIQFAVENWWASDYIAYYTGAKSVLSVECIEDTEVLMVHKDQLESLYLKVPAIEHFFRRQLEKAFVAFQKRILSNLHETAELRYEQFIHQYPNIEQRVRNYQIASYLGITPESLSRVRKARLKR
ncbi:MAG: Crp/Fnr family transcriptional regulator [Bacteroidota bacterium]